jgi:hypothetical protein
VSYEVKADPGVSQDLRDLGAEQEQVKEEWRLSPDEVNAAIDEAIRQIASLKEDPYQGEVMTGGFNQKILMGCRRLKFDPLDPPPNDARGRQTPRMRLVWVNEPDESSIALVRVLSVTHREDSRGYRRAASRLGALRRSHNDREEGS